MKLFLLPVIISIIAYLPEAISFRIDDYLKNTRDIDDRVSKKYDNNIPIFSLQPNESANEKLEFPFNFKLPHKGGLLAAVFNGRVTGYFLTNGYTSKSDETDGSQLTQEERPKQIFDAFNTGRPTLRRYKEMLPHRDQKLGNHIYPGRKQNSLNNHQNLEEVVKPREFKERINQGQDNYQPDEKEGNERNQINAKKYKEPVTLRQFEEPYNNKKVYPGTPPIIAQNKFKETEEDARSLKNHEIPRQVEENKHYPSDSDDQVDTPTYGASRKFQKPRDREENDHTTLDHIKIPEHATRNLNIEDHATPKKHNYYRLHNNKQIIKPHYGVLRKFQKPRDNEENYHTSLETPEEPSRKFHIKDRTIPRKYKKYSPDSDGQIMEPIDGALRKFEKPRVEEHYQTRSKNPKTPTDNFYTGNDSTPRKYNHYPLDNDKSITTEPRDNQENYPTISERPNTSSHNYHVDNHPTPRKYNDYPLDNDKQSTTPNYGDSRKFQEPRNNQENCDSSSERSTTQPPNCHVNKHSAARNYNPSSLDNDGQSTTPNDGDNQENDYSGSERHNTQSPKFNVDNHSNARKYNHYPLDNDQQSTTPNYGASRKFPDPREHEENYNTNSDDTIRPENNHFRKEKEIKVHYLKVRPTARVFKKPEDRKQNQNTNLNSTPDNKQSHEDIKNEKNDTTDNQNYAEPPILNLKTNNTLTPLKENQNVQSNPATRQFTTSDDQNKNNQTSNNIADAPRLLKTNFKIAPTIDSARRQFNESTTQAPETSSNKNNSVSNKGDEVVRKLKTHSEPHNDFVTTKNYNNNGNTEQPIVAAVKPFFTTPNSTINNKNAPVTTGNYNANPNVQVPVVRKFVQANDKPDVFHRTKVDVTTPNSVTSSVIVAEQLNPSTGDMKQLNASMTTKNNSITTNLEEPVVRPFLIANGEQRVFLPTKVDVTTQNIGVPVVRQILTNFSTKVDVPTPTRVAKQLDATTSAPVTTTTLGVPVERPLLKPNSDQRAFSPTKGDVTAPNSVAIPISVAVPLNANTSGMEPLNVSVTTENDNTTTNLGVPILRHYMEVISTTPNPVLKGVVPQLVLRNLHTSKGSNANSFANKDTEPTAARMFSINTAYRKLNEATTESLSNYPTIRTHDVQPTSNPMLFRKLDNIPQYDRGSKDYNTRPVFNEHIYLRNYPAETGTQRKLSNQVEDRGIPFEGRPRIEYNSLYSPQMLANHYSGSSLPFKDYNSNPNRYQQSSFQNYGSGEDSQKMFGESPSSAEKYPPTHYAYGSQYPSMGNGVPYGNKPYGELLSRGDYNSIYTHRFPNLGSVLYGENNRNSLEGSEYENEYPGRNSHSSYY